MPILNRRLSITFEEAEPKFLSSTLGKQLTANIITSVLKRRLQKWDSQTAAEASIRSSSESEDVATPKYREDFIWSDAQLVGSVCGAINRNIEISSRLSEPKIFIMPFGSTKRDSSPYFRGNFPRRSFANFEIFARAFRAHQ